MRPAGNSGVLKAVTNPFKLAYSQAHLTISRVSRGEFSLTRAIVITIMIMALIIVGLAAVSFKNSLDDRAEAEPKRFAEMQAAYDAYAKDVNLIEVPDDYNPVTQIQKNVDRNQGKEQTKKVPILD